VREHFKDRLQALFAEVAVDGEGPVLADQPTEKWDSEEVVPGEIRQRPAGDEADEERVEEGLVI